MNFALLLVIDQNIWLFPLLAKNSFGVGFVYKRIENLEGVRVTCQCHIQQHRKAPRFPVQWCLSLCLSLPFLSVIFFDRASGTWPFLPHHQHPRKQHSFANHLYLTLLQIIGICASLIITSLILIPIFVFPPIFLFWKLIQTTTSTVFAVHESTFGLPSRDFFFFYSPVPYFSTRLYFTKLNVYACRVTDKFPSPG